MSKRKSGEIDLMGPARETRARRQAGASRIVDDLGRFVGAHRRNKREPRQLIVFF